jgi:hypothetical protein
VIRHPRPVPDAGDPGLGGVSPRAVALARLAATAEAFPQLRIGQLIWNVVPTGAPLFYITDADLAKALDDYTREWSDQCS